MGLIVHQAYGSKLSDPSIEASVRASQIEAVIRLAPFNALTSCAVAIVFGLVFARSPLSRYVDFLALAVIAVATSLLLLCFAWQRSAATRESLVRRSTERVLIAQASLLGLLWATMPAILFPAANPDERLMIASTAAGLMAIAVVFAPVPLAAFGHSGSILAGSFIGLARTDQPFYWIVASLLAVYGLFILNVIQHLGRLMRERALDQAELDRRKDVIGLLLCDFEENASDWLWETDLRFRVRHASARFAEVARCRREDLQGQSMLRLAAIGWGDNLQATAEYDLLRQRFLERASFRALVLPVRIDGEDRWWSLTGRPVFDGEGRFTGMRGVGSDVTEAKAYEQRIAHLARYDSLTGLPNRSEFQDGLGRMVARPGASGFAVLCLDLDGFKAVNDTFGHAAGDALLCGAAERLRGCLRDDDLVARLAGDEFAILVEGADATGAADLSRRLIEAVARPFAVEGVEVAVGVSVGISLSTDGCQDILKGADLALYRAKQSGRGTFRFYESEMDARMQARRTLESDLRGALGRGEFRLLFQPLVTVKTFSVAGFEALLRWNCSSRGLVSPADFIPVAEETGLIIPIGEWVMAEACRVAAAWPSDLRVTINLSPVQFRSPRLALAIRDALRLSGLAPERLEVEITESILLEEKDSTLRTLHELREMGIRIALDDFGTGYSSLSYLRAFPFDKIKIDQSFVRGLGAGGDSQAIIEAIVVLARHLGMTTTAEGVETDAQVETLRAIGCSEVQGYLFSQPRPADELGRLLDAGRDGLLSRSLLPARPLPADLRTEGLEAA